MIVGIGTDLADIDFFEECLQDNKTTVISETFTAQEIITSERGPVPKSHRLAGRFAVKEAFFKALSQTTLHRSSSKINANPKEIEVCVDHIGRPYLSLHGEMDTLAKERGVKKIHVSISHEKSYALGFVILEG
ncbi:holo-ACP synthase [Candidatus Uabimicrobium helgolandensis]